MTRGRPRGVETADGTRFVTGCALTAPGSPSDVERDLVLVGLAAESGVQLVHLPSVAAPEVIELARDLGLQVSHVLGRAAPRRLQRLGWEHGDERDLPQLLRRPSLRPPIITDFGAPSVAASNVGPDHLTGASPDDLACIERHTPRAAFDDDDAWARATRNYQAMVVRFHVEAVRASDRPAGIVAGPLWHPSTGLSPSLLDDDLHPKEAYHALVAASRRRIAVADRLPSHLHGDEVLASEVRVLNDGDRPFGDAQVTATLRWADGEQLHRYRVDREAGAAHRVGTMQLVVPPVSGPLTLDVDLDLGDEIVTSTYRSDIYADPHDH